MKDSKTVNREASQSAAVFGKPSGVNIKCPNCAKNNLEIENLKRLLASIIQRLGALKTI